jgi:hypothetical protein
MAREKTVQLNVRVSPEIRELVRRHAESAHGHGMFLAKAVQAYVKQLQQSDLAAYWNESAKRESK